MSDVLFLSHRIPYPPDKGDKIRAWNILQHLANQYRVHLATFVDAAEDVRGVACLESVCQNVFWQKLDPRLATIRSLGGLLTGASLTKGYFGDARFRAGVREIIRQHKPRIIYVFSSAMLPYVVEENGSRIVLDLVDVDSEKWRQYAATSSGLSRWVYAREGRTLLELEREGARVAEAVLLVSGPEAELFKGLVPESSTRVYAVHNGVDTEYFNDWLDFTNPFGTRPAIVFTGFMDYRPNIDAMIWFVREVMPRLRSRSNPPSLWIVGANPAKAVRVLAGDDVCVTGRVPDVRPYLRHASAVVAPLRIGRGIQNKVLEAMAMGAPSVVTPQARGGLDKCQADELLTADNPADFANAVAQILDGNFPKLGARGRKRVANDYRWSDSLAMLDQILGEQQTFPKSNFA
jgi:sugar transferase (PEP-CTERM/EpsH1 system associated)